MSRIGWYPRGGLPISEEKGRGIGGKGFVKVGLRREERGGCDQDAKLIKINYWKNETKKQINMGYIGMHSDVVTS